MTTPTHAINRLLVANRGEIARRVMRTCRALGIETVAVFSDADANGAFVADADVSVSLGGNTPAESYLRGDAVIDAALRTGADAIHPGYGFLSENAEFARAVADAGLIFVGPTPDAIASMGSKLEAKALMATAGVPLLPSADLTGLDDAAVLAAGDDIGYPVLIKASAGGGGRGMRIVPTSGELLEAVAGATREAQSAFGDGTVYAERYVAPSRHVEVQIFGDASGRVVHFGERECSIQRRHQKIIEEAPSASISTATREALHLAAVRAGETMGYTNAGTVEFLLAPTGEFFFLEVNTRLQVEHPVTEAVFGVDLVALQLHVAAGGSVPEQHDIAEPAGHAVEARLYAEDPTQNFLPSTGVVKSFHIPGEVRLDTAIDPAAHHAGEVSQFYDPMIAKVVAHAPTREAACRRLAAALAGATITGIATNRELLVRTLRHPEFLGDQGDSAFLERHDPAVLGASLVDDHDLPAYALAAALALQCATRANDAHTPGVTSGFRNVVTAPQHRELHTASHTLAVGYRFGRGVLSAAECNGVPLPHPVLYSASTSEVDLGIDGVRQRYRVGVHRSHVSVTTARASVAFDIVPRFVEPEAQVDPGSTVATMPGTIVAVHVAVGDNVEPGAVLVVMEAMKMELSITASTGGTVADVPVEVGQSVEAGAVLTIIE